jgi:hypothetical protein
MSFTDRLVLWLHIGFAIFAIGPVTLAVSSTPRYIRQRDAAVLRYLTRITTIFTAGSLAVLVFGIILGELRHELARPWLTVAMTLFVVAIVLLALIIRDQHRAIRAVEDGGIGAGVPDGEAVLAASAASAADSPPAQVLTAPPAPESAAAAAHLAPVERGRIAAMGGVVNLIWLVVLALMVWQP